jgi:O-antigen/teichoic acid export membrane protein
MTDAAVQPRLGRSAVIAVATQATVTVIGGTTGVLVARLLGPAGKGISAIVMLVAWMVGALGACGIELWTAREVGRDGPSRAVRQVALRHGRRAGLVILGLGITAAFVVPRDVLTLPQIAASVLLTYGTTLFFLELAFVLGTKQMRVYAIANVAAFIVYFAAVCALLIAGRPSLTIVLLGTAASKWLSVVYMRWAGRRRIDAGTPLDGPELAGRYRLALRFGLPAAGGELLEYAIARIDLILVAALTDLTHAGFYVSAATLTEFLWIAPNAIADVLVPFSAARDADGTAAARAIRVSVALVAAAAVVIAVTAHYTLPLLFGADFKPAVAAVPPLAAAAVALAAWKLLCADVLAHGKPQVRVITGVIGVAVMLGSDLALIPLFGIVGAGFGSLLGYVVATVLAARAWTLTTGQPVSLLWRLQRADFALLRLHRRPADARA